MYWKVPRIVPRVVSGWLSCSAVGRLVACDTALLSGAASFASPKIEQLHARLRQHDVAGLQIAVDDSAPVRRIERAGDLDADPQGLVDRQRAFAQPIRQRLALEELHDQVVGSVLVAHVVKRANVRMRELRDRLRLTLEALPQLRRGGHVRRQNFDRDIAAEPRVLRLVDLPHPSRTDGREDLVGAEAGTG